MLNVLSTVFYFCAFEEIYCDLPNVFFMESKEESVKESRNDDHVQIKADLKEIRRRIAAFQSRKRKEIDELNLLEFCNLPRAELASDNYSCCRVDAVVVPRPGSKGHIKMSKVVNQWGPLTVATKIRQEVVSSSSQQPSTSSKCATESDHQLPEAIEERLDNMEQHLRLTKGKPIPKDIYARLKNLEDRILFLEGISTDYFVDVPRKITKTEGGRPKVTSELSIDEINSQIQLLRHSLLKQKK